MIQIDVITLFPELFKEHLNNLPFKKAISLGQMKINLINLRDFALDNYGSVDDKPYGGGTGMLLMIEPIYNALATIYGENFEQNKADHKIIALSAGGSKFTQKKAREYVKDQHITFICGRYEGMDARVEKELATETISIGEYVLSGGELPCLVVLEAVARLIPGVLEKEDAATNESYSENFIEYPQYTRPENFRGMKVPEILLSGDHKKIEEWRNKQKIEVKE
ncbi:tRNA (guanosine(37)-N1)-methyltransferase TrmD [candidate division WWE3 bacterium RIFOXYD1_FULL_39_9]|uniref:tRNA (guanine-N(1)-)-methyltransferase n=1 Tax=candidate division WWE3 bacterium RIFOXYD1_FULL_39_9 TaxID=1802649 RepID=A0A1F4X8W2_UNCKA|nr:MAG: tRNA (guanosine(37)-N1)-methyltransferase TrmD [candidate division WWE3 bacterium RIFOXYD1_FULL_39_9]